MGKDKSVKIIAIAALLVAVVGVSLGFAAFSQTLTISTQANVNPDGNFSVKFSTVANPITAGAIAQNQIAVTGDAVAANQSATVDNNNTKVSVSAAFTKPGQTATFTFYAVNDGEYDAYLKNIKFNSITGSTDSTGTKKCAYNSGVTGTASLLSAACANINVSVRVGSDASAIAYGDTTSGTYTYSANHPLAKTNSETVVVTVSYTGDAVADGAFTVDFGDIELLYESTPTV